MRIPSAGGEGARTRWTCLLGRSDFATSGWRARGLTSRHPRRGGARDYGAQQGLQRTVRLWSARSALRPASTEVMTGSYAVREREPGPVPSVMGARAGAIFGQT